VLSKYFCWCSELSEVLKITRSLYLLLVSERHATDTTVCSTLRASLCKGTERVRSRREMGNRIWEICQTYKLTLDYIYLKPTASRYMCCVSTYISGYYFLHCTFCFSALVYTTRSRLHATIYIHYIEKNCKQSIQKHQKLNVINYKHEYMR